MSARDVEPFRALAGMVPGQRGYEGSATTVSVEMPGRADGCRARSADGRITENGSATQGTIRPAVQALRAGSFCARNNSGDREMRFFWGGPAGMGFERAVLRQVRRSGSPPASATSSGVRWHHWAQKALMHASRRSAERSKTFTAGGRLLPEVLR